MIEGSYKEKLDKEIVLDVVKCILFEMAKSIISLYPIVNERYLHHYFTNKLEENNKFLMLDKKPNDILLHPEWPTNKKASGILGPTYKKTKKDKTIFYEKNQKGKGGWIDFCIGDYLSPFIGIEFISMSSWHGEDLAFDYLKLLDEDNPFTNVFSLGFIFREKNLAEGKRLENLHNRLNITFINAMERLDLANKESNKNYLFLMSEIDSNNHRRHWYLHNELQFFIEGLPG